MTARDIGHVEEIITHLKRVENDYHINLASEMEWLRGLRCGKVLNLSAILDDVASAAIEYCSGNKGSDARVRTGFLMGAEWMQEKMMEDAVDAQVVAERKAGSVKIEGEFINLDNDRNEISFLFPKRNLNISDKVKLLIVKEG